MDFIGNAKALRFLQKSLEKGNINHAYLFSGPEHVGKHTLARMFGRSIILGLKNIESAGLIDPTTNLDLLALEPEIEEKKGITKKRAIPTEKIRELQKELSLFPYYGARKVLIIDDAHMMTIGAQNALLKTLEEPADTSMIILVTHEEGRLLPTIVSRCQKLNFSLSSDEELRVDRTNGDASVSYAMGRPGLLDTLSGDMQQMFFQESQRELAVAASGTINEKLKLAEDLSKNSIQAIEKLTLWTWVLRSRATGLPCETMSDVYSAIGKIDDSVTILKTTNANARLVLENLFIGL